MEKVRCPYCGTEMIFCKVYGDWNDPEPIEGFYECGDCGSRSPEAEPEDAHAAARARWQEPNRVLTLEEVLALDLDGATCVEERKNGAIEVILNRDILEEFAEVVREGEYELAKKAYGHFSRAWRRRPTDEERRTAKWGDEG